MVDRRVATAAGVSMNFTLYALYSLAGGGAERERFTRGLPFDVAEDVRIENVSELLEDDTFHAVRDMLGRDDVETQRHVTHALVHRYTPQAVRDPASNEVIGEAQQCRPSEELVRMLGACLRLIRPTRQSSEMMWGRIRDNGKFDVLGFNHPVNLVETPENQKLFSIRNEDADHLRVYAPEFLRAMRGQFWKFRMAVQFHELGHWQQWSPKGRYLLWASAIESIYTSHGREHKGSLVAKERIKWFLGENTSIYPAGELSDLLNDPNITVAQIVDELYDVRNFIAHGDRIPDRIFQNALRDGFNGRATVFQVLFEAQSFIIRKSLLKILHDNLLDHFADAAPAEAYFDANGLTNTAIRARLRGGQP
jgi:hypothetical protein